MTQFNSENVEKVIGEFYSGVNGVQSEAHQWLTNAQSSPDAWNFCWDLINPNKPPETQFFGASTLHVKITKYWYHFIDVFPLGAATLQTKAVELLFKLRRRRETRYEVPTDQYLTLRKKLLEFLVTYANGPKVILNRLCIALASHLIHTIGDHWNKPIADIIATFRPDNCHNIRDDQIMNILLEILTVLPEEVRTMILPASRRGLVRNELQAGFADVLPILQLILTNSSMAEIKLQAIKCFCGWVEFGIPFTEYSDLVSVVLQSTYDDALSDEALDCLTSVVCHHDSHKFKGSLQKLIGQILSLESLLAKDIEEGDIYRCYKTYFLFLNLAETHSKMILEGVLQDGEFRDQALHLVRIVLQCTASPGQYPIDEISSNLVFNFWYLLQEDIVSSEVDKYPIYISYFAPVYTSLVNALLTKSIFPADTEFQTWNSDDREQFRCYRQDIGDTLMYCYNILREPLIELLYSHLDTVLSKVGADPRVWPLLEACLFAFESVAESIELEDNAFLQQFFERLPTIPFTNARVVNAALSAIGAYGEWIQSHPHVLAHVVPLLILGLSNKEMAPAATRGLKEICADCQQHMRPFAQQILSQSQLVVKNGELRSAECLRLMCSVGSVLSILQIEDILNYLNELLTPVIMEMEYLASQTEVAGFQPRVLVLLNMLAILFANLDVKPKSAEDEKSESEGHSRPAVEANKGIATENTEERTQPVLVILLKIMPIIHKVAVAWSKDGEVVEAVCSVFNKAVSTLLDDCLPLMDHILTLVVVLYRSEQCVDILHLVKLFILLFGKDENHVGLLRSQFSEMVRITLHACERGMSEQSDLLQGFLQVLAQIVKKHSAFLHDTNFNLSTLFQCGIVAMSMQETPTVKAASSFLVTFINQSHNYEVMVTVINELGFSLVARTLRCIGGEAPRGVMDCMADILLSLNKNYFERLCSWMTIFLHREEFPSPRVTIAQKDHYIRLILTEKVNKRKLQEIVKEFTLVCRGLMGTEYASQIVTYL